jgi:hypothetical protein
MIRNVRDLINELETLAEEFGDEAEVRLAHQPRWALEYAIGEVVGAAPVRARRTPRRREEQAACIWIGEGAQLGYLGERGARALGWSNEPEPEDDEDDDEPLPGLAGGSGPDFDSRDREGADEADSVYDYTDAADRERPAPAPEAASCEAIERSRSGRQATERRCTRRPHGPELAHAFGSWSISAEQPARRSRKGGR